MGTLSYNQPPQDEDPDGFTGVNILNINQLDFVADPVNKSKSF